MVSRWTRVSHLTPDEQRELQNEKLRSFMRHLLPYHPFYRELFEKQGIDPRTIRTTDDLVKIPFTTKADIAPTEDDRGRPRRFILQPDEALIKKHAPKSTLVKLLLGKLLRKDVTFMLEREFKPIHLHFTTGRSAMPTVFAYTHRDLLTLKESGMRMFETIGIPRSTVAVNGFPYSPHLAFWAAYHALENIGVTTLHTGGGKVMGTKKIVAAIESMKAQLVIFIPGYAYHVLREAVKQKKDFSSVKYIVFGGERVSQGLREKVRSMLEQLGAKNPQVFATYALTEGKTAWIQCAEDSGYHTYPDLEFFEIVDEKGSRVPPGTPGEIVYTSLDWRGSVVLRYRTGDVCDGMETGRCQRCSKTVPRIAGDIQRKTEMREFYLTKIKGELVNLNHFYPLLSARTDIEEWQVEIRKRNNDPYDIDEIVLTVAPKADVRFDAIKDDIAKAVYGDVGVGVIVIEETLDVLLGKLGMETELKEKRIIDSRPAQK